MADTSATSGLTGFSITNTDTSSETSRGTKIVKSGDDTLGKNAFLKILTAELSNQDPLNSNNDPTEYVSQMATFSSLEQMANLNGTMSLNSASNLIGKMVKFKDTDDQGNNYEGVITSIAKDGDNINLNFNTTEDGQAVTKTLSYNNVISVEPDSDTADSSSDALSSASNLIGKTVTFSDTDSKGNKFTGAVESVVRSGETIGLGIKVKDSSGKEVTQYFNYNDVVSVDPDSYTANTLSSASNLIGKTATFSDTDSNGNKYKGIVESAVKNGSEIQLGIKVKDSSGNTTTQYFNYTDVVSVDPASA